MDIYEPVIAEMKAQIEECQRVIVTLEMMRSKAANGSASAAAKRAQTATFGNDAFFGMTIADAAKKFLTVTKKTATARAIAEALVAGGFKTSAKSFVETLRSIVSRHQYFVFVNGEFGLVEWYPGRKTGGKTRSTSALADVESGDPEEEGDVIESDTKDNQ